jgi:hypothetical protein
VEVLAVEAAGVAAAVPPAPGRSPSATTP